MFRKLLNKAEKRITKLQGKGWGAATVEKEFSAAVKLLSDTKPSLFIDIGGNKGLYTQEIVDAYPSSNIVVFEPSSLNIDCLKNKFSNHPNITIEPFAVSSFDGETILYSDHDGSGLSSLTKRKLDHHNIEFENSEKIISIKFEEYWENKLNRNPIDLCKLDIEGHELDALNGFGEAINHIDVIQFEFGGCNIDTRTYLRDFWYFFSDNGYELFRITPFGSSKISKYNEREEFFGTTNYLAKRKATIKS
nr:FkbM family methyltransferase [uncultured Cohaesibacter sp.]